VRVDGETSLDPSEWVVPFHGLLLSPELRAREVHRREVQAARVALALRLREIACRQWLGRVEGLDRDRAWMQADVERLRSEVVVWRWGLVGVLGLVAIVAVAGSG